MEDKKPDQREIDQQDADIEPRGMVTDSARVAEVVQRFSIVQELIDKKLPHAAVVTLYLEAVAKLKATEEMLDRSRLESENLRQENVALNIRLATQGERESNTAIAFWQKLILSISIVASILSSFGEFKGKQFVLGGCLFASLVIIWGNSSRRTPSSKGGREGDE